MTLRTTGGRTATLLRTAGALALATTLVAGCQTGGPQRSARPAYADPQTTGSVTAAQPSLKATADLAKRWKKRPSDAKVALAYAAHLRALGSDGPALDVLRETLRHTPDDPRLLAETGKLLARSGEPGEAERVLAKAISVGVRDWRVHSAHGAVLDQLGRHQEARGAYAAALKIAPNTISVVNNLALSYALSGDLDQAEATLRQALEQPDARTDPRVRQNLALVLGLQGRFTEAEEVARKDLPPAQAEANMKYLRAMMSQRDTWQTLRAGSGGSAASDT